MRVRHVVPLVCFAALLLPGVAMADEQVEARAIIDQAIDFAGGREALARYNKPFVRSAEGNAAGGQEPFTIKITTLLPDKQRTHQTSKKSRTFDLAFNGEKGWTKSSGGPVPGPGVKVAPPRQPEMNEALIRLTRDRLYALWLTTLLPLDDAAFRLSLVPEITIANRPAVGVNISHDGRPDVQLFFDRETFAPVKLARKVNDRPYEELYDDYAELDGLIYAKKIVQYGNGQKIVEMQTTDLKFLDEVEEGTFEQP